MSTYPRSPRTNICRNIENVILGLPFLLKTLSELGIFLIGKQNNQSYIFWISLPQFLVDLFLLSAKHYGEGVQDLNNLAGFVCSSCSSSNKKNLARKINSSRRFLGLKTNSKKKVFVHENLKMYNGIVLHSY